uniref:methyltransferase, FxLD system n=1 Tax=Paractinoplanes polyasparticus TaxID=2856853 RepID=UPI001C848705|nr:methyltransferase, FxLD system [Actinoplanes polyasparticus]
MTVTQDNDPTALRAAMVESLRTQGLLTSEAVAAALSTVPRHLFAPSEKDLKRVYDINATLEPVRFADGTESSVVSAPHIQAIQLEMASIEQDMSVLEIGSGGYNAALLAELVGPGGRVTTVDINAGVVQRAKECLARAGYERVTVVQADAEHGVAEHAPYDRILVTVGAWDIPGSWLEQLTETGRIVVPLRFNGITRLIAFDRNGSALTANSYRLGAFVPMQGDGAVSEQLVQVTEDVGLRFETQQKTDFNVAVLREALHKPAVELWAGSPFDMPDELALFLLTTGGSGMVMMHAAQKAVDAGLVDPAVRHGIPALVQGGSFAYRIKRASDRFASGYEAGVRAHGSDAEAVGQQLLALIQDWGTDHFRRGAARIVYYPTGSDLSGLAGWRTTKSHGTLAVSWS